MAAIGLGSAVGIGSTAPSPEPVVRAFLYAWEAGQYAQAADLTTGSPADVARSLHAMYRQLGAAGIAFTVAGIARHPRMADAYFDASVDLGRGGLPWTYRGHIRLQRSGPSWKIIWSPSVIVPGLRAGQRLAVRTIQPARAPLLDSAGQPLMQPSRVYQVGVRPDQLKDLPVTVARLADAIGLSSVAGQLRGQILAAPPASFLELLQLSPADYQRLSPALHAVPGLIIEPGTTRLFDSIAPAVTGSIGTEASKVLLFEGQPYRPGTTVGLSDLEQAYQRQLAGAPTTQVEVESAAGRLVAVLKKWSGKTGVPVQTTIVAAVQQAAQRALGGMSGSAAIVAVRAGTGQLLAVAEHAGGGLPAVDPLAGRYQPGQAFTMISAAALLNPGCGGGGRACVQAGSKIPCLRTNPVGGETFSNSLPEPNLGAEPPFWRDFAHACSTAFLGPSQKLTGPELAAQARAFGVGSTSWRLPLPAFAGQMPVPVTPAQLAADVIGTGSIQVSPLDMALAAGVIQSGSLNPPSLVVKHGDPPLGRAKGLSTRVVSQLQQLLRAAVRSGAARAANVAGSPVFGQVGLAPLAGSAAGGTAAAAAKGVVASWFVGYRGTVAFAVVVLAKSAAVGSSGGPAARLAGKFAAGLRS